MFNSVYPVRQVLLVVHACICKYGGGGGADGAHKPKGDATTNCALTSLSRSVSRALSILLSKSLFRNFPFHLSIYLLPIKRSSCPFYYRV